MADQVSDRDPDAGEFAFLADEARELGVIGWPAVQRISDPSVSALRWGAGRVAAVWLHGAGLNAHTWDGTILASGLESLAIDLPGHGDSPWRADLDYSPVTNAAAVRGLIRSAVPEPVLVVGQSLGGMTAIALAARYPGMVKALVVVDVNPGLHVEAAGQVRDFLAGSASYASRDDIVDRAVQFGIGTSRAGLQRGVFLNTRVRADGRVVFKHHLANLAAGQVPLLSDFAALWPAAESLQLPVLLLRATRGVLTDDQEAEFVRRVPQSSSVRIDSGHNVQEDAPAELAAAITDFLGSR